jgi:hypothetical protein
MRVSQALLSLSLLGAAPATCGHIGSPSLFGSSFGMRPQNAIYDYSIVGGGTAGLVVANQLAEDPILSIAVVEPGSF